jgi:hypothetical protein
MTDTHPPGDDLDTTAGDRDPLTTDDGLAAAAAGMPVATIVSGPDSADAATNRELQDTPDLDVDDDGTDPCASIAAPWTETGPGTYTAPAGTPAPGDWTGPATVVDGAV